MSKRPCKINVCDGPAGVPGTARGMCSAHYNRWRRNGDPRVRSRRAFKHEKPCTVGGCDRQRKANGLCSAHERRRWVYGNALESLKIHRWTEREIARDASILDRTPDGRA